VPVSRRDFHVLVQALLRRFPTIQGVEWAPKIAAGQRQAFESVQQGEIPGFAIRERAASGELQLAGDRAQYYPVTYIEPLAGKEAAAGFDLVSDVSRRAAIDAGVNGANVVATAPIRLVQERGEEAGVALTKAVSGGPSGPGIVLVALRMGSFVTTLLAPMERTLGLRLVDANSSQPLFDNLPASVGQAYETALDFGTRRYLIRMAPSAIYLAEHRGWQSWLVLAGGVFGTGLLGALLMLGTGHAFRFKTIADELREGETRMRIAQQAGHWGIFGYNYTSGRNYWSPDTEALYGLAPGSFEGTHEGWRRHLHPDDREGAEREMDDAQETGEYSRDFRVVWDDGSVHWLFARAKVFHDSAGHPLRMLGVNVDITERKRAEEALRAKELELQTIIDRTPFMLTRCSRELRDLFVSQSYGKMIGRRPEDVAGKPIIDIMGEEGFNTILPHVKRVLQGERVEYESEIPFAGVGPRLLSVAYTPEKDSQGNIVSWIASIVDITERKRVELQRDLLIAELNHRVKNTLATVISIAHQSFRKEQPFDVALRSFSDRIRALAQTHSRLAETSWSGVSLKTIIDDETAPYRTNGNLHVVGQDVRLNPKCALSLGMAFHELATNAAKYGALSDREGSVQINWKITPSGDEVRLNWIESGGPRIGPPKRSGFGRRLLEKGLASDLRGTVELDFRDEGVICLIAFPLDQQAVQPHEDAVADSDNQTVDALQKPKLALRRTADGDQSLGARILVVKDEALVALEIERILNSAGASVIGPFGDITKATQAARREAIDLAALDINLNDEMVLSTRRGTGYTWNSVCVSDRI
jgi:PAS domain S-box-containing protein